MKEKLQFLIDFQHFNNGLVDENVHYIGDDVIERFIETKIKSFIPKLTKTEKHKLINRDLYIYFKTTYPNSDMCFEEGGRVMLYPNKNEPKNVIEYHQSLHDFWYIAGCSSSTKKICKELENVTNGFIKKYNL